MLNVNIAEMAVEIIDENGVVVVETLPIWRKRRYWLLVLTFIGCINVYTLRINLSLGIVAMTENKTIEHEDGSISYEREFDWDSKQKGVVQSSFFYGYICTQFLGGILARRYGGHIVLGLGIFSTSVFTLLSPLAAHAGLSVFVALRVLMGFAEGVTFPCIHQLWSKWAPPHERSRLVSVPFAGTYIGIVLSMSSCGALAQNYGWESVFYVFGAIGCVWYIFWAIIIRKSPAEDPWINDEERRYIEASLKESNQASTPQKIPWLSILSSSAVWAIAASQFAENWGGYTMLTQLPSFLKHKLEFDLASSGFIAAVPYLVLGLLIFFVGYLADWFQLKSILTTVQVRKYFNCTAFISQGLFMMLAAYQNDRVLVIIFIIFGASLGALSIIGYGINHLDIAPQFASILIGVSNTVGTIPGIISPLITGYIVTDPEDPGQWKWIFILTSCVYAFGTVIYWFFASGSIQPWAQSSEESKKKESFE